MNAESKAGMELETGLDMNRRNKLLGASLYDSSKWWDSTGYLFDEAIEEEEKEMLDRLTQGDERYIRNGFKFDDWEGLRNVGYTGKARKYREHY